MRFEKQMEYRGSNARMSEKTGKAYTVFNLEDIDTGEAVSCVGAGLEYVIPSKGTYINCNFDLNLKYGSVRLVDYEVVG